MRMLTEIVDQHITEASFLWGLRDQAVTRPQYRLMDVARLDERVEAHLDALRIAGDGAVPLLLAALENIADGIDGAGNAFAAAQIAVERGDTTPLDGVFDAVAPGAPALRAIASALAWGPFADAAPYIEELLDHPSPARRFVGIAACCARREDDAALARVRESLCRAVVRAMESEHVALRRRATEAVGECGLRELVHGLPTLAEDAAPEVQLAAAWSASLLGDRSFAPLLANLAVVGGVGGARAITMAVRRDGGAMACAWIKALAAEPATTRMAIVGAGALGDPTLVPWLIEYTGVEAHARVAGESLSLITGIDLEDAPYNAEPPPPAETEDEAPDDPDDDLPWPAPDALASWWTGAWGRFATGRRYLLGEPITVPHVEHVLKVGGQRQRAAAAIERRLLGGSLVLSEVRAQVWRHAWKAS